MARVLIVLDGEYRFTGADASGTDDFTYITLVNALESAGHVVTKAHRQSDTSGGVLQTFNFDTSVNLLDFDVLWLIGHAGRNSTTSIGTSAASIDDIQLRAIARFMAAGGGVFATGDHDSIGSVMCGRIPRVRSMRCWFGVNDSASPMPAGFPRNFPVITSLRADTTQRSTDSVYSDTTFVWFENQSDRTPQPITPTSSPAHPILRRAGSDIVVYPDHMHEGNTLGEVMGYDYAQSLPFAGESFDEYPVVAMHREMPQIIATGKTTAFASRTVSGGGFLGGNSEASGAKNVNTLSVYDGRVAGVGRVVTGSTFHHYVDINLTGDSSVDDTSEINLVGEEAQKNHGFNDGPADVFDNIKAVFVNIVNWLARPRPRIQLILERSTFSQAEALASSNFDGAILIIIDGLKPNQFPGGTEGITSLADADFDPAWAPTITPLEPAGLSIIPIDVDSDDPTLSDRLQRITFTYRVQVTAPAAFGFPGDFNHVQVNASLSSPAVSGALTDSAQITLVKSANPFMLDLASGNTVPWLSTDLRVFTVVAGAPGSGLINNASRAQALSFLRNRINTMTVAQFEALPTGQQASALSPFPTTISFPPRRIYNFAVARVRLPASGSSADDVRVFFRIFVSQTTAALTYNESPLGTPIEGYKKSTGTPPIAVPGVNSAGTEWLSFPMFSAERMFPPETQIDDDNLKDGLVAGASKFYGALIDNNLNDAYLPASPISGGGALSLPTLMMGEHQCIVAQIEFPSTPIPNGANPFTTDKLSQRNLALSPVANPGLDASRIALHTFEIEATPHAIGGGIMPDELLLQWHGEPPDGVEVHLEISSWDAREVVDLAERFYPRHEIRALSSNTIAVPGGGVRYVPIPRSDRRQTGVITVHFPLGVKENQRFDISVRQVTTRGRQLEIERPKVTTISREDAAQLLKPEVGVAAAVLPKGAFDLGKNKVLITDLRLLDAAGDHALIIEHPDPEDVAAALVAGRWRETIGAFQLGIPVSNKAAMLDYQIRLLSVMRWRAEWLSANNRWYLTFRRYVELIAEKVRDLGGDPSKVPPTPDGIFPLPGKDEDHGPGKHDKEGCLGCLLRIFR